MTDKDSTPHKLKLIGFLSIFIGLTALGAWWAAPPTDVIGESWAQFTRLEWPTYVLLAIFALGLVAAATLRLVVFGRLMGVRVGVFAALEATIADNFFSWVTPGSALGEPAAAFMLNRHGIDAGAALTIAYTRFATSFAFIFTLVAVLLGAGFGPPMPDAALITLTVAVALGAMAMLVILAGALAPERAVSMVDAIEARFLEWTDTARLRRWINTGAKTAQSSIERLAWMRRHGLRGVLLMGLSHVLYYAAFIGVFCVLAAAFQANFVGATVPRAVIYLGFIYLFPTPGGAGGAEASADLFFEGLLPVGAPFVVVMLFRAATFYLHVVIGLIYLPMRGVLGPILADSSDSADDSDLANRG
jgi:uncharacterized protein (TIRG00374 family)